MITKSQALSLGYGDILHYTGRHACSRTVGPRGGVTEKVTAVRVTGRCQTWKTRPEDFRLPVKYGLRESSAIEHTNSGDWHTVENCPMLAEQRMKQAAFGI